MKLFFSYPDSPWHIEYSFLTPTDSGWETVRAYQAAFIYEYRKARANRLAHRHYPWWEKPVRIENGIAWHKYHPTKGWMLYCEATLKE